MLEAEKTKVQVKSVHWGIMQVIGRSTISDLVKGYDSRRCLEGFKNTYLKDDVYKLDDPTMQRITELIAMDGPVDSKKQRRS